MAYAAWNFNTIQLGREVTAGTAVAATEKWRGEFSMLVDNQAIETVEEQVGLYISPERTYTAWESAELQIPSTPLTYEQVPHVFEAGLLTVTPTGAGPYTYDYVVPVLTRPAIQPYTIEGGNADIQGDNQEMPYSFVTSFRLSGTIKQSWMMESTWMGQRLVPSTLTPALPLLDVEQALFGNTQLFIDPSGGTIGTTQLNGVLMQAEINCTNTGIQEVPTADGTNYYSQHKLVGPEMDFSLTFELEDTANAVDTARAAYRAQTPQLIQLLVPGTGGRSIRMRMTGRYTDFPSYTNDNGNTSVQIGGTVSYNSTDNLFFECQVINNRANLD
ncbi:MAG: hypothetical protein AAF702_44455 [Chloroflexota bacterium]